MSPPTPPESRPSLLGPTALAAGSAAASEHSMLAGLQMEGKPSRPRPRGAWWAAGLLLLGGGTAMVLAARNAPDAPAEARLAAVTAPASAPAVAATVPTARASVPAHVPQPDVQPAVLPADVLQADPPTAALETVLPAVAHSAASGADAGAGKQTTLPPPAAPAVSVATLSPAASPRHASSAVSVERTSPKPATKSARAGHPKPDTTAAPAGRDTPSPATGATVASSANGADADVDLLAALIGHSGKGAPSTPPTSTPKRAVADTRLATRVRACQARPDKRDAQACQRSMCEGHWGKASACPRKLAPRDSR